MTVNNLSASTALNTVAEGVASRDAQQTEAGITVLKKIQDQMKLEGQAMIQMIEQVPVAGPRGQHLDVYA